MTWVFRAVSIYLLTTSAHMSTRRHVVGEMIFVHTRGVAYLHALSRTPASGHPGAEPTQDREGQPLI